MRPSQDACAAMTERGGLQGILPRLLLRVSLFLVVLGVASLQLQSWASDKALIRNRLDIDVRKATKTSRNVKHKTLVVGQAAGQGTPGRIQCRDVLSNYGNVTRIEPSKPMLVANKSCLHSERENVIFVTLFVLPKPDTAYSHSSGELDEKKKATSARKMEKDKLHAVLRAFLESIQVSMPGTRVVLITNRDKGSVEGELPQNVDWKPINKNYNRKRLMIQRLESYIEFLDYKIENWKNGTNTPIMNVVFSDFDILLLDDLSCVFKKHPVVDVALTFRNNLRQPINSGVMMIRGTLGSLFRGKLLLGEVLRVYRAKFRHAFGVLGDQLALADVVFTAVEAKRFQAEVPFEAAVLSTKTLFLPCSLYNWTPSEGAGQFHGMPTEVKALHFKGSRKRLMIQAWSIFKQHGSSNFSKMMCLVLGSGRSKYDY